jgi:hypothetical protein
MFPAKADNLNLVTIIEQVAHRLLLLCAALLPSLRSSALRACPSWALEALLKEEVEGEPPNGAPLGDYEGHAPRAASFVSETQAVNRSGLIELKAVTPALPSRTASVESLTSRGTSSVHAAAGGVEDVRYLLDGSEEGGERADVVFGAWAANEKYGQWKRLQWTVQVRLPSTC